LSEYAKTEVMPIYDPERFKLFCHNHGAPHLFNFISACMTSSRHTRARKCLNEKRTVSIILQLCFELSQKCSLFQVDNGILLRLSHCTKQGLNTQRIVGTSTCSMTIDRALHNFSSANMSNVISALDDAIKNRLGIQG
jgi:hypothetical protein